jgi:hypothetical protein
MENETLAIAKVCHEANRAYCETIGDRSQPNWENAPNWQRESAVKGVEFHLNNLRAGTTPSPSASHESWMEEKRAEGWKFGEVKDPVAKTHPCFLPYEELPIAQRMKDYIFGGIVQAFFACQPVRESVAA